jgi:hypothetical protein
VTPVRSVPVLQQQARLAVDESGRRIKVDDPVETASVQSRTLVVQVRLIRSLLVVASSWCGPNRLEWIEPMALQLHGGTFDQEPGQ